MDVTSICFDQQRRVEQFLWWIMFDIFVAVDWTYQQKLRIYRWCVSNKCIHSGIILALYSLSGPYYPIECGAAANNLVLITHASALSVHAYWNNMTCSSQFRWAHHDWSRPPLCFCFLLVCFVGHSLTFVEGYKKCAVNTLDPHHMWSIINYDITIYIYIHNYGEV